jgi:hypothetical protein
MGVAHIVQIPTNIIVRILLRHFRLLPERNEAYCIRERCKARPAYPGKKHVELQTERQRMFRKEN